MYGSREVATFGKRKAAVAVPAASGTSGLIWIIAGGLACLFGAAALALLTLQIAPLSSPVNTEASGGTQQSTPSETFLAARDQRPEELRRLISQGVETCLPVEALVNLDMPVVAAVTNDIYLKILTLLSQEVSDQQRQVELKDFVRESANSIPTDQRDGFRSFMTFDPYSSATVMCVGSAVRMLL